VADEGYFRTLDIRLIRGRTFGKQDDWDPLHVAVISQSLARQRWPNQDPNRSSGRVRQYGWQPVAGLTAAGKNGSFSAFGGRSSHRSAPQ
jgi:hypothetical protein